MATYVFCPRQSQGALELSQALGATRLRRFDGMDFWSKGKRFPIEPGNTVICWGTSLPDIEGVRMLNPMDMPLNKFQEWEKLVLARVPSPKMIKPNGAHTPANYRTSGYVGRSLQHTGGLDLLNPPAQPFYYTYLETFVYEYRIHSFDGRSIRAGVKVLRDGFKTARTEDQWTPTGNLAHPWIRSYDGGWKISYDGFASTAAQRDLAHKAVKALGLTFGAVDIAQRPNGGLCVLEVNTAPGIEGGTLNSYVRAINRWIKKEAAEGD